jgi:type I restriction enzyme M protein
MAATSDIVARLWGLCNILRDDGITYHEYVTELTFLLFLKMAKETGSEGQIPKGWRWADLVARDGLEQLTFYRKLLINLGQDTFEEEDGKKRGVPARVVAIFANASTALRQPRNLAKLIENIDQLDWYSAQEEGLGELYEGLLEKNANEKKSGAGQYFTPRPLIDCMVALIQPKVREIVQDPAAGTGGFLVAADRAIKGQTDGLFDLPVKDQEFQRKHAFQGMELVPDTHRLLLMNLMLHGIESDVRLGDTLSSEGAGMPKADVILSNPPFGTKSGGGSPTRDDFTFPTSNKQLAFLQHIYRGLKPGGRAAVVLPDNVLFEAGTGRDIRADLMDKCDLHTILRLPTGIFYAGGVKTNVLFFTRSADGKDKGNTKNVWIYDLRTNIPVFGKRTPLTLDHFAEFMAAYGKDPYGKAKRKDGGEAGRWRKFSRKEIAERGDNLDVTWLRDEGVTHSDDLPEPEEVAAEIMERLRVAMEEMEALSELLVGENMVEVAE